MAEIYRHPLESPYGAGIGQSLLLEMETTWNAIVDDDIYTPPVTADGAITLGDITTAAAADINDPAVGAITLGAITLAATMTLTTPGSGGGGGPRHGGAAGGGLRAAGMQTLRRGEGLASDTSDQVPRLRHRHV